MQHLIQRAMPFLNEQQRKILTDMNEGFVAIGAALPPDMQLFVSENWKTLGKFLASQEGEMALQQFVNDWKMK